MPSQKNAEHPYAVLAKTICEGLAARGVVLLVVEGVAGDNWGIWTSPEVMARLPEILEDCANEIIAGLVDQDASTVILTARGPAGRHADLAEKACRLAEARAAFLYVQEGREGSSWSLYCLPEDRRLLGELVSGCATDMRQEELRKRHELGLEQVH